ncbi:FAD-dependent oxidoreductase [Chloroflexota bacterium]
MKPDAVFIATGSTPIVPDIPGVEKENVVTATDLLLGRRKVGEFVVVLGGGLVGNEVALYLAQDGKKVTVVARHDVCSDMFWSSQMHLMKLLADAQVEILKYTQVDAI